MKEALLAVVVGVVFCLGASGQTFKYSQEVKGVVGADVVQLVANVSGFHHLLFFTAKEKPKLFLFDSRLKLFANFQLDAMVKDGSDIRIVSFGNYYLLYIHAPGSTQHNLWRIEGDGRLTPLSAKLQAVIQAELTASTVTLQLLQQKKKLFLLAHTYFDSLQATISKVVKLDENLDAVNTRKAAFSFRSPQEVLHQVDLAGDCLLILKSARNSEQGHLLRLLRVDLNTGETQEKTFASGPSLFSSTSFSLSAADSSILLHGLVRSSPGSKSNQTALFLCRLNDMLEEKTPVRTEKLRLSGSLQQDYFWVNGVSQEWLSVNQYLRPPGIYQGKVLVRNVTSAIDNSSEARHFTTYYGNTASQMLPFNIHLTLFSDQLARLNDSVLTSKDDSPEFVPYASTTFRLHNNAYLLLTQQLPRNNKSLLLVSADKAGKLETTDLPVYGKYDYQVNLLQPIGAENAFLIPYFHKRQMGLLKISINE